MTNMVIQGRSGKKPSEGDIFQITMINGAVLYGRVISTACIIGPMKNCNLIYIYKPLDADAVDASQLSINNLLVPPLMTNDLPWKKGYFKFLKNEKISKSDVMSQHVFVDSFGRTFDEFSRVLTNPNDKAAQWGLHSYRTIDDEISDALGLPLAPD